jgi:hypothetical protein
MVRLPGWWRRGGGLVLVDLRTGGGVLHLVERVEQVEGPVIVRHDEHCRPLLVREGAWLCAA